MTLEAIFFDAGNTLVFADESRMLAPLGAVRPTQEQLYAAERFAKQQQDTTVRTHAVDHGFWHNYYHHLLRELDIRDHELHAALIAAARTSGNWRRVPPDAHDVLGRLQKRFRLGVISNSDGGIRKLLDNLGLSRYFETITDSAIAGFEKPDPRIFRAALDSLGASPEHSLYVGDVYSIDFVGAQSVGMRAVLMDVSQTYLESGLPRVETLTELEKTLGA